MKTILRTALLVLFCASISLVKANPDGAQITGTWYIESILVMGAPTTPDALHAADRYTFNADMTFDGVIEGAHYTGTYAAAPTGNWITIM